MKCTLRILAVALLAVGTSLGLGCSSDSNPGNYGDACTIYAVGPSCTGSLLCRCIDQQSVTATGCFCTQPCVSATNCPGKFDMCLLANDPSQSDVLPDNFCFQFTPDGGQLP